MKTTLKLEELAMALAALLMLYGYQVEWWWYLLFLLGPDISFLGYLGSNKVGAIVYNFFHHKAVAAVCILAGLVFTEDYVLFAGLLLLAHSTFDRVLGFGLKYPDDFNHSNIGYL